MENEELIRQNMERTRESLTDKLETLEQKLVDSVQEAKSAVTETVTSVKETMHESVESVKDAVDIPAHVERRPWLMLGGSVLCGYLLGTLIEGPRRSAPREHLAKSQTGTGHHTQGNGHSKREKKEGRPAAGVTSWLSAMEPEIQQVKGLALGAVLGTVREMLTNEVPPHMADELRGIIDAVTKKMGGEPLPSSDFEFAKSKLASTTTGRTSGELDPEQPRW